MYEKVGLSLLLLRVAMTALWSLRYGPGDAVMTEMVCCMSLKIKSSVLPDLCVEKPTCWCSPMASMESLKIAGSISSSLTCKLKSPMYMLLGCEGSVFETNSMKSSMNIPLVILLASEGGGR